MARIRSIHPGLWTDEKFVALSPIARLFFMGVWCECDDNGSFEWSPLKLKMRLLPADNFDASDLLAELEVGGVILRYEEAGRSYGAVRNFCQYQRPKKPTSVHPQSDAVREWVRTSARLTRNGSEPEGEPDADKGSKGGTKSGSKGASGEVVGKRFPTGGEKSRQRKEEGGSGSSVTDVTGATAPGIDPVKALFDAGVAMLVAAGKTEPQARRIIGKWRGDQGDTWTREAIASAAGASDPVAFIEGRKRSQTGNADEARALSAARAERYRRMNDMPGPPPGWNSGVN
ncbi:hypothetical protein [Sphingomonas lacusdianchii]|uniref:hypothetical protein n=1 Tax=Sphingomonas lacusdianchii TaxID=2917992 RepID=UPI001F55D7C5|nr:hypothetical protein [Sphingomonas sp. JXJ CY 53]